MLNDPLSVTYNGSAKSLPRVGLSAASSMYKTADGEFEITILSSPKKQKDGRLGRSIIFSRVLPDPTPGNSFDDYRVIRNSLGLTYGFDVTRAEASVDIPLLRAALLSLVDTTLQGRIINGEK